MGSSKTTIFIISVLCAIFISGCESQDEGGDMVIRRSHDASMQICKVLNAIDSEESAKAAIPELKKLAIEYTQAKAEFLKYQKENPRFEQKYLQESLQIMQDWGKALSGFNTNQNVPEELRKQIMEILSL